MARILPSVSLNAVFNKLLYFNSISPICFPSSNKISLIRVGWRRQRQLTHSHVWVNRLQSVNTLRPRQNSRHFPDDISKCIFLNENAWILIKISLKLVLKGPINNPALVQIMVWRRPGDKPLAGPMMVYLTATYIFITRPQRVNVRCLMQIKFLLFTIMRVILISFGVSFNYLWQFRYHTEFRSFLKNS